MPKTWKRFSKEEDNALLKKVSQDPSNLAKIFREMSEEYGRSADCYSFRWYVVLSNPNSKHYAGVSMIALSKKRALINRKQESKILPSKKVKSTFFTQLKNNLKKLINI